MLQIDLLGFSAKAIGDQAIYSLTLLAIILLMQRMRW
jgi:hypothetical protein